MNNKVKKVMFVLGMSSLSFLLFACNGLTGDLVKPGFSTTVQESTTPEIPGSNDSSVVELSQQEKIFQLAKASGYTGTYEEWLESIKGDQVEIAIIDNALQWRYVSSNKWSVLIDLSELKGEDGKDGQDGAPGKDGQDGTPGKDGEDGQTPYIGTNGNWWIGNTDTGVIAGGQNGAPGKDGQDGVPGKDGEDGQTPYIGTNGNWWIGNTDTGVYAKGEIVVVPLDTYTVSFDTGCDIEIEDQTVQFGHKVEKPEMPQRKGYTFEGWFIEDEQWIFKGFPVTESMTLTARWSQNNYNVYLDAMGGKADSELINVYYGDKFELPAAFKEGYKHIGWVDEIGKSVDVSFYGYDSDTTFYAKYAYVYDISFDSMGGSSVSNLTGYQTINELPTPTKEGYSFSGWYYNGEKIELPYEYPYEEDITLEAGWISYTDGYTYVPLDDNTAKLLTYRIDETNITIPTTIGGYTVTEIDKDIFNDAEMLNQEKVEYISIPNTLTYIPNGLLESFTSLKEINISDTIPTTMKKLFNATTNADIPETIETISFQNGQTTSGASFFSGNTKSYRIVLAKDLDFIGYQMFNNCNYIRELVIQESTSEVRYGAVTNCHNLETVYIPKTIKSFDKSDTFDGCEKLDNVYYGGTIDEWCKISYVSQSPMKLGAHLYVINSENQYEEVKEVDIELTNDFYSLRGYLYIEKAIVTLTEESNYIPYEFLAYNKFVKEVIIKGNCTDIGENAFNGCSSLESVIISDTVINIGPYAFYNCEKLNNIVLPEGLKMIEDNAFYGCKSLTKINIPESVVNIGIYAFGDCVSLTSIVIPSGVSNVRYGSLMASGISVYYVGSKENWEIIANEPFGLTGGENPHTLYFYSKNEPTSSGNYWHYDEEGNPVVW